MQKRLGTLILCITAVMALLAMAAMPALAHHKDGHEQGNGNSNESVQEADQQASSTSESQQGQGSDGDGDADNDSNTAYTEDNDTNDGGTANNVEDDGDNQHPSGKDRSVENGGSGTQGKSESHPDDSKGPMRYEGGRGPDKANGPGGEDLADQDGNNGCGNDDDFDDDNNGHCGKPRTTSPPTCPKGGMDSNGKPCEPVKTCPTNPNLPMDHKDCNPPKVCPTNPNLPMDHKDCNPPKVCPTNPNLPMDHKDCNPGNPVLPRKITICHATGSATNPYVIITIDLSGLNGHGDHDGDIIPMPIGGCPGLPVVPPTNVLPTIVCPAGTDMAGLPPTASGCNLSKNVVCPAGTDMAGLPPGAKGCNTDDVLGRVDEVKPSKVCPAGGPFAGMPMLTEKDCAVPDSVLPNRIRNEANPIAVAPGRVVAAVGAVLPFTGAGDLYFAIALGLLLVAAGSVGLKLRKTS
jgi:hypothetical protein